MSVKNQTSLPLGIVVERRAVDNPWIDHSWRSVAVIAGARALSATAGSNFMPAP
jgi:hypothetical protein